MIKICHFFIFNKVHLYYLANAQYIFIHCWKVSRNQCGRWRDSWSKVGNPRTPSTASGSSRMENDPGQSTTTTLGVDDQGAASTDVACLKVVDDHGTSSASGGISSRDSSLSHHHPLLVVQLRWTILEHPCHIALYKLNCIVLLLLYMYIVYDSPLNLLDIGL